MLTAEQIVRVLNVSSYHDDDDDVVKSSLPFKQEPPKKKRPGFHLIKLAGSKKLQRLHNVLLAAKQQNRKMSSLELTKATSLTCVSTYISHLRFNGIAIENETRRENGQTIWYYWIP